MCRFQQVNVPSCSENNGKNLLRSHFHYRCRLVLNLEGQGSLRFKNMRLGDASAAFVSVQKKNYRPRRLWIFPYIVCRAHLLRVMINSHNVQLPVGLRAQMIELCNSTVHAGIFDVFSSHLLNNIQNCMITSTLLITPQFKYVKVTHIVHRLI